MYDIIVDNYSRIFPLGPERIDFVKSFLNKNSKLLDIGCATGDLCIAISKNGYEVIGIDLNSRMIEIVKQKIKNCTLSADFRVMNMLEISEHFEKEEFSLITCFGNTLPHLASLSQIEDFFKQVYSLLSKDGFLVFQILNYDKILDEWSCIFPVVKKPDFTFTREYEFYDEKIRFTIGIEIGGKKLSDSTNLFPLRKEPAVSLLKQTGFQDVNCYENYLLTRSTGMEFSTLYVVKR